MITKDNMILAKVKQFNENNLEISLKRKYRLCIYCKGNIIDYETGLEIHELIKDDNGNIITKTNENTLYYDHLYKVNYIPKNALVKANAIYSYFKLKNLRN